MIAKDKLVDGAIYFGTCRNATLAVWDDIFNKFSHITKKLGGTILEELPHPEDDDGYDCFIPERVATLEDKGCLELVMFLRSDK